MQRCTCATVAMFDGWGLRVRHLCLISGFFCPLLLSFSTCLWSSASFTFQSAACSSSSWQGAGVQRQRGSCPLWVAKRFTVWKIPIPCIISLTTPSASPWLCGNPFVPPSSRLAPLLPVFFSLCLRLIQLYLLRYVSLLVVSNPTHQRAI